MSGEMNALFDTVTKDGGLTLEFKYRHYEIVDGKCVVPAGTEDAYRSHAFFKNFKEVVA